jgi:hypothetical protein
MNKLYGTFRLTKALIGINQFNNVHSNYHRQAKKLIKKIITPINLDNAPSIPSNAKLKMQWYMAECLYACEKFNGLIGQTSTATQRRMYLQGGMLGAMCDMVIDDIDMNIERVKSLKRPTNIDPIDTVEHLYITCYSTFVNSLEEDIKERTIQYYELLFDAQVRSKLQFDQNITRGEVDNICKEKCGFSMLFLRSMVKGKMTTIEKDAWFELGAFVQYCNDAQDLHKDLQKNMRTFASTRPDIEIIAKDLDKQKTIAFSLIKNISFQKEKKDNFLFTLHLMSIVILSKLHAFSSICNYNFSFEKFLSKSKKEIRSKLTAFHLFSYGFSKIINYQYENVENPYQFEYKLTNMNISTTKNKRY